MRLGLVQPVLVLLALVGYHCIFAEDADHEPTGVQHPIVQQENVQQKTIHSESHNLPFTGHSALTADALIALVQKDYADRIPVEVYVRQIMDNVIGSLYDWGKSAPLSWLFYVDVRVPWMTTCKPVIRGVTHLAPGIVCPGPTNGCSQTTRFKVAETYQATEGLRIETTFSVGAGYGGVDASISATRERYWEKTWGRIDETEVEYTWNLHPNTRCIPSMAHLELECQVDFDTTWYDSYFRRPRDFTDLEYRYHRAGGPFESNQWCFKQRVSQVPLRLDSNWYEVLPNDGFSGSRGDLWKRPASEMNQRSEVQR